MLLDLHASKRQTSIILILSFLMLAEPQNFFRGSDSRLLWTPRFPQTLSGLRSSEFFPVGIGHSRPPAVKMQLFHHNLLIPFTDEQNFEKDKLNVRWEKAMTGKFSSSSRGASQVTTTNDTLVFTMQGNFARSRYLLSLLKEEKNTIFVDRRESSGREVSSHFTDSAVKQTNGLCVLAL